MRVVRANELDRSPCELDRASGRARFAGELGCPGAQLGEVEPGELRRVRDGIPQRDRALEMGACLRQAEDRLRLACRFDRSGERLGAAAGGGPVRGELGGDCGVAAREFLGEPSVQLLAFAGEDRPVDRFRQERVTEAELPVACSETRTPCSTAWRSDARTSCSDRAATARSSGYPMSRPAAAAIRKRLCAGASSRATR